MPANLGLQISLELTKLLPIRSVVDTVGSQILKLARDLRLSGSDLVVEEDLAEVFGRGLINPELEAKFKDVVKVHNFVPLSHGCVINLESGPGPTMLHAFRDKRYFAMVIQISLLAWMHRRQDLAFMLSQAMTERFDMGVPEASPGPGIDGIIMTLTACSSQSSAFSWSYYVEQVDRRFRESLTNYYYHADHLKLTPPVLLAAMDYLYLVQRFPEDRKITVSNEMGCMTLIVWAHYVLGLTVAVVAPVSDTKIFFGNNGSPHVIITWSEANGKGNGESTGDLWWYNSSDRVGPEIRLLDSKMSVILESTPEAEGRTDMSAQDRHPLANYGATYLQRLFNTVVITSDNDPIYEETAKLITALAIHVDKRLDRKVAQRNPGDDFDDPGEPRPAASVEIWRLLAAARLIFGDIPLKAAHIDSYVKFLGETTLDEDSLPITFNGFLKKVSTESQAYTPARRLLFNIKHLATVVLIFGHVFEVESCGDLPVVFIDPVENPLKQLMDIGLKGRAEVDTHQIFFALGMFLNGEHVSFNRGFGINLLFLCSDFGWSIFLDTVGDKDPGIVRPELVHIKRGTPTNSKTKERKLRILDGYYHDTGRLPDTFPLIRGLKYSPRLAARVKRLGGRQEYWTSGTHGFECTIYLSVEPSPEWRQYPGVAPWQEMIKYRKMQRCLWDTHSTPYCDHSKVSQPEPTKLGPDAVALMGFDSFHESGESYPERILIYLTRGDARIRWLAIGNADCGRYHPICRDVMLRTDGCCDACALEHTASLPGRWTLIL